MKPATPAERSAASAKRQPFWVGAVVALMGLTMLFGQGFLDGSHAAERQWLTVIGTAGDGATAGTWVGEPGADPASWRQLTLRGAAYHDGARVLVREAVDQPGKLRPESWRAGRPLLDTPEELVIGAWLVALGVSVCLLGVAATQRVGAALLYLLAAGPGSFFLLHAAEVAFDVVDAHQRGVVLPATLLGTASVVDVVERRRGRRPEPTPRALLAFTTPAPDSRMVVTSSAYRFRAEPSALGTTLAIRYRADDTRHVVLADDWSGPLRPLALHGLLALLLLGIWVAAGMLYWRRGRS